MKNNTNYSLKRILHSKYTLIFTFLFVTSVIMLQSQYLHAAPQQETQKDISDQDIINTAIEIDISNNLGEREEEDIRDFRGAQKASISNKKYTSEIYFQKYGNSYKEKILLLYPASRSMLYMAYPDIPNNSLIKTYTQNFETYFREEAKETIQGLYDYIRDKREPNFTFAIYHTLLFEIPFYSDELRIVSFYEIRSEWGNSGGKAVTVWSILKDGKELVQEDMFTDYNKALASIAKIAETDIRQRFKKEIAERKAGDMSAYSWISEEDIAPSAENYDRKIAFKQNGDMLVYYDRYQIVAGAYGQITITIPYNDIAPLLSSTMKQLLGK